MYVGHGRATYLSSLSIIGDIYQNYMKASPSVLAEYDQLRKESNFFNTIQGIDNIVITLLNIQTLKLRVMFYKRI